MDQINQQDLQPLSQFRQFQVLKKAIQILFSVSVFSFLFSYYSSFPFLLHSFHHHVTAFSMELFTYTIHRNYIFLLCNGILVFLIMKSGLITNPQLGSEINDKHIKKNGVDDQRSVPELSEPKSLVKEEVVMEDEEDHGSEKARGDEDGLLSAQDEDKDEDDEDEAEDEFHTMEEGEEGIGLLSAEELNKKCDDFIKKMKGIKIEAQQLIMV